MYWCLPDGTKCEWVKLKPFVDNYNITFSTDYRLHSCLDVINSGQPQPEKQPEMRLKPSSGKDMVIEHKIITWPIDYIKVHKAQHEFMELFVDNVKNHFTDELYILVVNGNDIPPKRRTYKAWASRLAEIIIANKERINEETYIYGQKPIKWKFMVVPDHERDEDTPENGVGVHLDSPFQPIDTFFEDREEDTKGIKAALISHLAKASEKFRDYEDCIKVFVTAIHGDGFFIGHDLLEELLPTISLPANIDQIWVEYPEWVDNSNYTTQYRQIVA